LLSFLAYNKFEGEVKGIKNLQEEYQEKYGPGNYVPPVFVSYWTFRIMVGAGFLMLLLGFLALRASMKETEVSSPRLMRWMFWALFLPYIANSTGWIFTEMARQPWIVFGLQKVSDGVSNTVGAGSVAFSLITFTLLYALLMVFDIKLLTRYAKAGIQEPATGSTEPGLA
ncbi:MAG TPA: cytochrome ubiquinol oxidase subunit I, partial [Acidobacteria bacterium]|nr:cytochrome ubiquinol oxidase subunit I [Acidobacteriota bacterium]